MSINIISRTESITNDTALAGFTDLYREFARAVRLEAAGNGVLVAFTVTFSRVQAYGRKGMKQGSVQLFRDHGIRPVLVQQKATADGSLLAALTDYANQRIGVEAAGYVVAVEMTMFAAP